MRSITIRRLKSQAELSVAAKEVEKLIQERDKGTEPKTLKGAAFGAWYAKLTGPTIMWMVGETTEYRDLEEVGLKVAGTCIHSTEVAGTVKKGQFYAHRIVDNTSLLPEQQLTLLKNMGQVVAEHGLFTVLSLEQVESYLVHLQHRLGVSSLTVCDPKLAGEYATFKATKSAAATTTVSKVLWNLDRHGNLLPRLKVVPVIIKGTLISNVSGHNAAFIENHSIGIGTTIRICYEPGTSPIVDEVIGRTDPDMPCEKYEWAGIHVRPVGKQLGEY